MAASAHGPPQSERPNREAHDLKRERYRLLIRINRALEGPMTVLGFVWLVLLVISLTSELSPFFSGLNTVIWGLFVMQFVVEVIIAPDKKLYFKRQWITALSLLAPAFRLLRAFRIARTFAVMRGTRLVRIIGGANRGMRALGRVMERRGFGYVLLLTLIVAIAGGAGMFALERGAPGTRFDSLGSAFWWSAMTLTTMGADFFPVTPEGRILCLLLAIYGFAVFGYVTATVASYFVARDADDGELAGSRQLDGLAREIARLNSRLEATPPVTE